MNENPVSPAVTALQRVQMPALIVGIIALVLCAIGAVVSPAEFFRSYLTAYIFWLSIALGCLFLMLVHQLVGGAWGYVMRRFHEAGMWLLIPMAILFIPLLFGLPWLYIWARPAEVSANHLLQMKSGYLNIPFFIIRAIIYFAIWLILAYFLRKWSLVRDETNDPAVTIRMKRLGAGGIVLFALTCQFAYVDWLMSLDPFWASSIYSAIIALGGILAAHSLTLILFSRISDRTPFVQAAPPMLVNDLGNLLMGFVIISTYLAFSQLIIIWAANLPEEIVFYIRRWDGGWQWVAVFLAAFQFFVPLLFLISRRIKRNAKSLARLGGFLMFVWLVNLFVQVVPTFSPHAFTLHWLDFAAPIGVGGLFIALFIRQLSRRPILPMHIPPLPERYHV